MTRSTSQPSSLWSRSVPPFSFSYVSLPVAVSWHVSFTRWQLLVLLDRAVVLPSHACHPNLAKPPAAPLPRASGAWRQPRFSLSEARPRVSQTFGVCWPEDRKEFDPGAWSAECDTCASTRIDHAVYPHTIGPQDFLRSAAFGQPPTSAAGTGNCSAVGDR